MIPKTEKLVAEENKVTASIPSFSTLKKHDGPIEVRPIECCNDFVAILVSPVDTNIALTETENAFKNEGLVVGVGPGISDGHGGRLTPCVKIGDVVMFGKRNVVATINAADGHYTGQRVDLLSERNILCKLNRTIDYNLIDQTIGD